MGGFRFSDSRTRSWPLICVACFMFALVCGILSDFNATIFQYDKFGIQTYYTLSAVGAITTLLVIFRASTKAGVEGRERFYLTVLLSGILAYGSYLLEVPDHMLSFFPGFWATQVGRQDLLVPDLSTTKFRGRFRHYAGFGDQRGVYSTAYFPILESTYNQIVSSSPTPPDFYHDGIDVIRGVCFETEVATAAHSRRIDVGDSRAPSTSFKKC